VRWNDPAFRIRWPIEQPILNERDRAYADFVPAPPASSARR
jgi:dTDP-4-dehydrorhamnose 3,5-epimerase-like enzyme